MHDHPCIIQYQSIHTFTNWLLLHLIPHSSRTSNRLPLIHYMTAKRPQTCTTMQEQTQINIHVLASKPILPSKHDQHPPPPPPLPSSTPTRNLTQPSAPTPILFLSIYLTHSWTLMDKLASLTPPFKNPLPEPHRYLHIYLLITIARIKRCFLILMCDNLIPKIKI